MASSPLGARLARALSGPGLNLCRTSALAIDIRSGRVVFAHRAAVALAPASNEKLAVAYAALVRLGPGYRFRTEVLGAGRLEDATWRGDLVLRGFGDPTLTRADLVSLAAQVKASGIRRVTGRVLGDGTWFDLLRAAPGWAPSFLGDESPPLSARVVDRGRGWPALSTALLAAKALTEALEQRGVRIAGWPGLAGAPPDALPLAQDLSARLAAIVRTMNRESDNFVAEMVLKPSAPRSAQAAYSGGGGRGARSTRRGPDPTRRRAPGRRLGPLPARPALRRQPRRHPARGRGRRVDPGRGSLLARRRRRERHPGTRRLDRRPTYGQVIGKTGTTRFASSLSGFVRGKYAFAVPNGDPVPA